MSPLPVVLIGSGSLFALIATLLFLMAGSKSADGEEHLGRSVIGVVAYGIFFFGSLSLVAFGVFRLLIG